MRRLVDNDYLTLVSRLLIGGMMIAASYYKIVEPESFARSIYFYHIVPGYLINLVAITLPWLELILGVAVIAGFWYRGAVLWANVLLIVFIAALTSTIVRGLDIDCGCFKAGHAATDAAWDSLVFDLVAIIFSLQLWFSRSKRWMVSGS